MLKQIFIVNTDLKMRKGKIATQVAHGEVEYMQHIRDSENKSDICHTIRYMRYIKWRDDHNNMMRKIILKANYERILSAIHVCEKLNIWHHVVHDKGLTQVEPNSLTCIVVEPLTEQSSNVLFADLKLL